MPRIDKLWYEIDADMRSFDRNISGSQSRLTQFTQYAATHPVAAVAAIGAAAFAAAVKLSDMGAKFEFAMARVNTAAQVPKEQLRALGQGVLDIAKNTGTSLDDLTKGLYDIVSSGIPAAKALQVLQVAAEGAVGGVTNVAVVVDGLTSILNAYKDQNLDVTKVQDEMFESVNKGKITYEELAGSIGQVVGITATLGVSLDDVLGVVTQLSLQGIHASEAITGVRSAITNILQPSQKFKDLFPELAAEFNEGKLRGEGFTKFLIELNAAAKGNNQVFATLFGSVEAYKTALAALHNDGKDTVAMQQDIANASGAAKDALDKMGNTTVQAGARLKQELNTQLTELGQKLLPAANGGLQILSGLLGLLGTGTNLRELQDANINMRSFIQTVIGGDEQLGDKAFANFQRSLGALLRDVKLGTVDISKLSDQELTSLQNALDLTASRYQNLSPYVQDLTNKLKAQLEVRAKAHAVEESEAAAQRQNIAGRVDQAVVQGRQSAQDILTPPTEAQGFLTALRQRDAATAAINRALADLDQAKADAEAAQALGSAGTVQLQDAQRKAEAARATIEAQRSTLKEALEVIRQGELKTQQLVENFTTGINTMMAQATHGAADNLIEQLRKIDEQADLLRKKARTEPGVAVVDEQALQQVHDLYEGLVLVAVAADRTKKVLEQTAHPEGTRATPEDFEAINNRITQLKQLENGLDQTAVGYADRRRDIELQIAELEKRRTELTDKNLQGNKNIADELARIRNQTSKLIQDHAQALQGIVSAATQIAQAFGIVDEHFASMITSSTQVVTNIAPFLDQLDKFRSNAKDGKGNPLATLGDVVGSALPIVGGLTALAGALFGGNDAAAEAQRQIMRQNTDAIQALTRQLGEFGKIDIAGKQFANIKTAITAFLSSKDFQLFGSGSFSSSGPVNALFAKDLNAELAKLGLSMADLKDLAKQLGITIDDNNLAKGIKQLNDALKQVELTQFAQTFTGQLDALNAEFELFDISDPIEQLKKLVELFDNPNFGAPALRNALAGLDLTTPEGQAKAKEAVQALFNQLQAGTLTPDQLGGLTPQQFLEQLLQIKKLLDTGAAPGTGGFNVDRTITEATGSYMAGLLLSNNIYAERTANAAESIARAMGLNIPLPSVPPPSPSGSTATGSTAQMIFNITVNVTVGGASGVSPGDASGTGTQIGQEIVRQISRGLQTDVNRRSRLNGVTVLT